MATVRSKKRSKAENDAEYLRKFNAFSRGEKMSSNDSKYFAIEKANTYAKKTASKKKEKKSSLQSSSPMESFMDNIQNPPKDLYELQQRYPKAKPPRGVSSADTEDYYSNPPKDVYELQQRIEDKKKKKSSQNNDAYGQTVRSGPGGYRRR